MALRSHYIHRFLMGLTACLSLIKNWSDYHSEFKRICENSELSDTQRPQLKCQYNNDVTNCTERKLKIYISHQRDEATTCKLDFADIFSRSNGICFFLQQIQSSLLLLLTLAILIFCMIKII